MRLEFLGIDRQKKYSVFNCSLAILQFNGQIGSLVFLTQNQINGGQMSTNEIEFMPVDEGPCKNKDCGRYDHANGGCTAVLLVIRVKEEDQV